MGNPYSEPLSAACHRHVQVYAQRTHLSQACPRLRTANTPVTGMSTFTHNEHTCHRNVQVYTQRTHLSQARPRLHTTNTPVTGVSSLCTTNSPVTGVSSLRTTNTPVTDMSRFTHNEHTCHRRVQVYTQRTHLSQVCPGLHTMNTPVKGVSTFCLLYTSDAADER